MTRPYVIFQVCMYIIISFFSILKSKSCPVGLRQVSKAAHPEAQRIDGLMQFLDTHMIDIKLCHGESYYNVSTMSGRYNGHQAKVAAMNNLDTCLPYAGLSLNLVLI